jgi:hypothetical protein
MSTSRLDRPDPRDSSDQLFSPGIDSPSKLSQQLSSENGSIVLKDHTSS